MVDMVDPDYTVLSSQNTVSYFTNAAGSFVVAFTGPDLDGNGVPDNLEPQLAERFAPIYKFHQNNPLFPMPVEAVYGYNNPIIINNSSIYLPLPTSSGEHGDDDWSNLFNNVLKPSFNNGSYNETVYFRVFNTNFQNYGGASNTYYVIQYWCYYPYNDASNVHEGDWEHIDVILDDWNPGYAEPVGAVYYRHHTSKSYNWNQLEVEGEHPVVYVGGRTFVETITGETKTRDGHEITGGSFVSNGWHYGVDFPTNADEGLFQGIATWRMKELIIDNRTLFNSDYDLLNLNPAIPLWWVGYYGNWGANSLEVKAAISHSEISIHVQAGIGIWYVTIDKDITYPEFSEPPQSPPHHEKWENMDRLPSIIYENIYGPWSKNSVLCLQYTLLADADIEFKVYTTSWQTVRTFGQGVKQRGTHTFEWNWKFANGDPVAYSHHYFRIKVEPANLFQYFFYDKQAGGIPD